MRFAKAVYVLHCFQKKSPSGIRTARKDVELIYLRLNDLIKERKLTQTAAAEIFGIVQSHVSELRNFKLRRFSSERLLHFITTTRL